MKCKLLVLSLIGFIGLSATIKSRLLIVADLKDMVMVNGDTFFMGIDSVQLENDIKRFNGSFSLFSQEYPSFRVSLSPFYIDKYEVTNADFKKFIDANPQWSKSNIPDSLQDGNYLKDWKGNKYPKLKAHYPVVYVCWHAANAYAHWKGKRLPMEVEREYAAKGIKDKSSAFPWGNADADATKANYRQSHIGHAVQVGNYPPNSLGLYDMAGNVKEFCIDRWRLNLYAANAKFRNGKLSLIQYPSGDKNVVIIRGGSWDSPPVNLRTTYRDSISITKCTADVGFRCAVSGSAAQNIK